MLFFTHTRIEVLQRGVTSWVLSLVQFLINIKVQELTGLTTHIVVACNSYK